MSVSKVSVYCVTHRDTEREYIGITQRRPAQRWSMHKCDALTRNSQLYFHRALRKYGVKSFSWDTLLECLDYDAAKIAERELIRTRKPAFNGTAGGDGATNPTLEVRQKMRSAALGRVRSPETRARMSQAKKLMWRMRRLKAAVRTFEMDLHTWP